MHSCSAVYDFPAFRIFEVKIPKIKIDYDVYEKKSFLRSADSTSCDVDFGLSLRPSAAFAETGGMQIPQSNAGSMLVNDD
jgi:hypothetical protein